jgi:hypothetical protein
MKPPKSEKQKVKDAAIEATVIITRGALATNLGMLKNGIGLFNACLQQAIKLHSFDLVQFVLLQKDTLPLVNLLNEYVYPHPHYPRDEAVAKQVFELLLEYFPFSPAQIIDIKTTPEIDLQLVDRLLDSELTYGLNDLLNLTEILAKRGSESACATTLQAVFEQWRLKADPDFNHSRKLMVLLNTIPEGAPFCIGTYPKVIATLMTSADYFRQLVTPELNEPRGLRLRFEVLEALSESGAPLDYLRPFITNPELAKYDIKSAYPEDRVLFRAERLGIHIPNQLVMPYLLKSDPIPSFTAYALESPRIPPAMLEKHLEGVFMSPIKEDSIVEGLRQVFSDPLNTIAVDSPIWEKATMMINVALKIRARSKDIEKKILNIPNLPDALVLAIPALLDSKLSCDLGL